MLIPQVFQLAAVEHSRVMDHTDLPMTPVRMVTHPSTNQAHGCLTPVINHEMLTPSY